MWTTRPVMSDVRPVSRSDFVSSAVSGVVFSSRVCPPLFFHVPVSTRLFYFSVPEAVWICLCTEQGPSWICVRREREQAAP